MIQVKLLLILSFLTLCWAEDAPSPPSEILWPRWAEFLIAAHLVNMTAELVKDADYKLEHAGKIQQKYMHTITYELGAIAAGIQDSYKHMIEIYRTLTNMTHFMRKTYDIYYHLNAYHVVQGDYNQIRLEQSMFYDILEQHEEKRRELEKKRKKMQKFRPPMPKRRGGQALWRDGERKVWGSKIREADFMRMN